MAGQVSLRLVAVLSSCHHLHQYVMRPAVLLLSLLHTLPRCRSCCRRTLTSSTPSGATQLARCRCRAQVACQLRRTNPGGWRVGFGSRHGQHQEQAKECHLASCSTFVSAVLLVHVCVCLTACGCALQVGDCAPGTRWLGDAAGCAPGAGWPPCLHHAHTATAAQHQHAHQVGGVVSQHSTRC